jgi:hypothetical protein
MVVIVKNIVLYMHGLREGDGGREGFLNRCEQVGGVRNTDFLTPIRTDILQ